MEKAEYKAIFYNEEHHWWYEGMRSISFSLLSKYLPFKNSLSILDAGCGTGYNLVCLKQFGDVRGIDISDESKKFCKERGFEIELGSIQDLPYQKNSFDLITCFDVLYHADVLDEKEVISEFFKVLKPGGMILMRVPAFEFLKGKHDKIVHTRKRYTTSDVKALFPVDKFKILRLSYLNFFLFPLVLFSRILSNIFPYQADGKSDIKSESKIKNFCLNKILSAEKLILNNLNFPWGSSVICLAQKNI